MDKKYRRIIEHTDGLESIYDHNGKRYTTGLVKSHSKRFSTIRELINRIHSPMTKTTLYRVFNSTREMSKCM